MKPFIAKLNWMPKRAHWLRKAGVTRVCGDGVE
jgi:hypothetical protein